MDAKTTTQIEQALERADKRLKGRRMSSEELAARLTANAGDNKVALVEAEELAKAREANRKSAEKWAEVRAEQHIEDAVRRKMAGEGSLYRIELPEGASAITQEDVDIAREACKRTYPNARGVRVMVRDFYEGPEVVWEPILDTVPKFDRIRRITGYLVGTLDRFNNGKRAEEHDRVKHLATV